MTAEAPTPTKSVRMFDVDGAAEYLGVNRGTVQRWANQGTLKGFRDRLHPGGPWRFTQEGLDALKREMQTPN
jgi:excisionase family DNA binding protein